MSLRDIIMEKCHNYRSLNLNFRPERQNVSSLFPRGVGSRARPLQKNSKKDLESSDLFAIGVTVLELAVPSFTPRTSNESNEQEIKKAINKLKETMPRLANSLEILIFYEGDKFKQYEEISKSLYPKGYNRNMPIENIPLACFSTEFQQYMFQKFANKACQSEKQDETKQLIARIDRSWKDEQIMNPNTNDVTNIINNLKKKDFKSALKCYESLVLANTFRGRLGLILDDTWGKPVLNKVLPIDALTYSIIGTYQYFKYNKPVAKQLFAKGLKVAKDKLSKLILLHNLGCFGYCARDCLEEDESRELSRNLKKAYDLIVDMSPEVFCILTRWMEVDICAPEKQSFTLLSVGDENKDDRTVVLLFVADFINFGNIFRQNKKEQINQLILIVFTNFCYYSAICFIQDIQKRTSSFVKKLEGFVCEFYQQKYFIAKLPPYLEVLQHLIKFCKVILSEASSTFDSFELKRLYRQAEGLYEKKEYLYRIFERCDSKAIFQELKHCDLFRVMIGCIFKFKSQKWFEEWSTKQILCDKLAAMSEITSSVDLIMRVKEPNETNLFDSLDHSQHYKTFEKLPSNTIVLDSLPQLTDDRINILEMSGSPNMKDNLSKVRDIFETLRTILDSSDADMFHLPEHILPFISILGIRVPIIPSNEIKQKQWSLAYIELQKSRENWHHPKKSLACLKMLPEDSAFVHITPRWELEFEIIKTQLQSQPLLNLELVFFQGIRDEEQKEIEKLSSIFSHLKSLQQLKIFIETNFANTKGIEDLGEAIKGLEKLEVLNLTFKHCPFLTNEGVLLLGDYIAELAKLRHLNLEFLGCLNVTKEGINELNSQKLVHLQPIKLVLEDNMIKVQY